MTFNRLATVDNRLVAVANKAHKKHPNSKCQLARHKEKFYSSNVVNYLTEKKKRKAQSPQVFVGFSRVRHDVNLYVDSNHAD